MNNYLKRKSKESTEKLDAMVPQTAEPAVVVEQAPEPSFPCQGYDVFTSNGGKTYGVAMIDYNPDTGVARVTGVKTISRLIALKYAAQKQALGILAKKANDKE